MFLIYPHTKLHIPSSSASLVIAVKVEAEESFHTVAVFFYILHTKEIKKIAYILEHLLPYIILGPCIKLC